MIRCIAVDDEQLALELLQDNIEKIPYLQLVAKCRSAREAMAVLAEEHIDLMFADIEMPDINGLQLVKSLRHRPAVIFITAYEKYALKGYELDILDYLMKPVAFDRFLQSVNKAIDFIGYSARNNTGNNDPRHLEYIFVRSEHKILRIDLKDIHYVESMRDYVKIYTGENHPILSINSLKSFEEILPANEFVRVHRSYIISLSKINYISRSTVFVGKKGISVSAMYRERFFALLNNNELL